MAMNRSITVTIFLALSLFFALASARLPLDPAEYGHGSTDLIETDPMTSNTLLLPSEPEPVATAEIKPDQAKEPWIPDLTELEAINDNRGEAASLEAQTAPLRPMRLRPVNRHFFPKRPMFVRRNRGGCHHHGEPMVKPWPPREHLSFGNDMVMMGQDERQLDGKFQSVDRQRLWMVRPIEVRQSEIGERREEDNEMIPLRPHHHRHGPHGPHDHHDEDGGHGEDDIDHDHDHDHHHHHHHRHHHDHDHDEEREEEEDMGGRGGIFKGIRKFLNHF